MDRRSLTPQKAGLLFAVAFTLIAAGVTLWLWVRGGGATPNRSVAPVPVDIGKPPPVGGTGPSGRARVQFVRKDDPTKAEGEMQWEALEPAEEKGRSNITQPRAWIYLRDGRALHVQAAKGRIYMPEQGRQPESGRFEGGVLARLYEPTPGGRPVDLEKDAPSGMFYSPAVNFDFPKGEVSTTERILVSTPDVEFKGTDMVLVYNRAVERLEYFKVERDGALRYTKTPSTATPKDKPTAGAAGATDTPSTPPPPQGGAVPENPANPAPAKPSPLPGVETVYHATFAETVRVRQRNDERGLDADQLQVWARLINNQLPEGAIAGGNEGIGSKPKGDSGDTGASSSQPTIPTPAASTTDPSKQQTEMTPSPGAALPATETAWPTLAANRDDDVTMTWVGPLQVVPKADSPENLDDGTHVAAKFDSPKTGSVAFRDTNAGIEGNADSILYDLTKRDLTLDGGSGKRLSLKTRDGKQADVAKFEVNLGSGIAHVPGGGTLGDGVRRIAWEDQADFVFGLSLQGWLTDELREASFTKNVKAQDKRSTLTGDFLRVIFATLQGTREGSMTPQRLFVEGHARGTGSDDASLSADAFDVAFRPTADGKSTDPQIVTAKGNVVGTRGKERLTASWLEASLERRPVNAAATADKPGKERLDVGDVAARGDVRFDGNDGVWAACDELRANAIRQTATLTGTSAAAGLGPSRVDAPAIELNGTRRTLATPGGGRFRHWPESAKPESDAPDLNVTWAERMQYEDSRGEVECVGDVVATADADALTTRVIRGHRATLVLEPEPKKGEQAQPAHTARVDNGSIKDAAGNRRLVRADVYGTAETPATAESRWYIADSTAEDGKKLERFIKVYGGQLAADNIASTVTVPGPGKAAVYDGRTPEATGGAGSSEIRGASLFTWAGGMTLRQRENTMEMKRGVTLLHRPLKDGVPIRMECEALTAMMESRAASADSNTGIDGARADKLSSVKAVGAVYVESGLRKLIADEVAFDAPKNIVEAFATGTNRISLYDDEKGSVMSARRLIWNRSDDRVEIKESAPTSMPR